MAKRTAAFNLSEVIRAYRKGHKDATCSAAFEEIGKANPSQKINEGTFKSTFYKLAGKKRGKRRGFALAQVAVAARRIQNGAPSKATPDALKFLSHFESSAAAITFLEFVADVKDAVLA